MLKNALLANIFVLAQQIIWRTSFRMLQERELDYKGNLKQFFFPVGTGNYFVSNHVKIR